MKRFIAITGVLLLLGACETNKQDAKAVGSQVKSDVKTAGSNVERHSTRIANNVRDSVKRSSMKLREWWLTPLPEEVPTPVATSYCYKVWQDVVCYRQPLPGMTHMLVGYQGDNAAPPPVAQTEQLPMLQVQNQNAITSGEARVTSAKPVFDAIPEQQKEDPTAQSMDGTPAVGSEPLPDPSLSPQL